MRTTTLEKIRTTLQEYIVSLEDIYFQGKHRKIADIEDLIEEIRREIHRNSLRASRTRMSRLRKAATKV